MKMTEALDKKAQDSFKSDRVTEDAIMNEKMNNNGEEKTMEYSLRKVKVFEGQEGMGFNAELLRDGRPVAFVINSANGGEFDYQWYCVDNKEMLKLREFARAQAPVKSGGIELAMDMDLYVGSLLDTDLEDKQKRKWCRSKCVFRLKGDKDGEYRTIPVPKGNPGLMAECIARIKEKYGGRIGEILNEKYR